MGFVPIVGKGKAARREEPGEALQGRARSLWMPRVKAIQSTRKQGGAMLGRRVIIVGLVAKPELNGRAGTALHFDDDMGRYSVKLDEPSSMLMQLIKPCNLLPQESRDSRG